MRSSYFSPLPPARRFFPRAFFVSLLPPPCSSRARPTRDVELWIHGGRIIAAAKNFARFGFIRWVDDGIRFLFSVVRGLMEYYFSVLTNGRFVAGSGERMTAGDEGNCGFLFEASTSRERGKRAVGWRVWDLCGVFSKLEEQC